MAATDIERLVVSLEAKMTAYEKAMNRALGLTNQRTKQMETRFTQLETRIKGIGVNLFKGFAGGALSALAPILSITAAVQGAKEALSEFGAVADNAKASGLDSEFFQGIAYQAQLAGVGFEEVSAALATFNKNAGLAVVGKGKMVASLKALDSELLENIRNATSQEQRLRLVADALNGTSDASRKAAIATAAFGDAGLKLVDAFTGGSKAIDETMAKARDLGLIVDRELIARADELGDEFETTSKVLDLKVKQALVNLGPVLLWLTGLAADFSETIGFVVDSTQQVSKQTTDSLAKQLQALQAAATAPNPFGLPRDIFGVDAAKARQLAEEIFRRGDSSSMSKLAPAPAAPTSAALPTLDEVASRDKAAKAAVTQAEKVRDLIKDLELEKQTIGLSAEQQEIMNTLRRAGVDAASAEGAQIAKLVTEINEQEKAQKKLEEAMKATEELAKGFADDFLGGLREGKSAVEALSNAFGNLANKLIDMALNNAIAGLLGTLFGGGGIGGLKGVSGLGGFTGSVKYRANGGPVSAGQLYRINERGGSEYFMPGADGMVLPKLPTGGSGRNETVRVVLQDDSGRMADIADRQIRTASGTIVKISVAASEKKISGKMAKGDYRALGVGPGLKRS